MSRVVAVRDGIARDEPLQGFEHGGGKGVATVCPQGDVEEGEDPPVVAACESVHRPTIYVD